RRRQCYLSQPVVCRTCFGVEVARLRRCTSVVPDWVPSEPIGRRAGWRGTDELPTLRWVEIRRSPESGRLPSTRSPVRPRSPALTSRQPAGPHRPGEHGPDDRRTGNVHGVRGDLAPTLPVAATARIVA